MKALEAAIVEAERHWARGEVLAGAEAVERAVRLAERKEAAGAPISAAEARALLERLQTIAAHVERERRALDGRLAEAGGGRRATAAYQGGQR